MYLVLHTERPTKYSIVNLIDRLPFLAFFLAVRANYRTAAGPIGWPSLECPYWGSHSTTTGVLDVMPAIDDCKAACTTSWSAHEAFQQFFTMS